MNDKYGYFEEIYTSSPKYVIQEVKTTGCGARKIRQKAFDSFRYDKMELYFIRFCRRGYELFLNSAFKAYQNNCFQSRISSLKSTAFHSDNKNAFLDEEFTNLKSDETSIVRQKM